MSTYKIAHITPLFHQQAVMHDIIALGTDQKKHGWEVEIITGRHVTMDLVRQVRELGFPVTQIQSFSKYINPLGDIITLVQLCRLLRRKKFDLVHTHLPKAGFLGRLAAKFARPQPMVIYAVHGAPFSPTLAYHEYWLFWLAERIAGALTDKFIFVSKDIRDWFIDAKVSNPGKSAVSYVPWNLYPYMAVATISEEERQARRQTAGFSPETIVLGNVSRIVPWKGHEYGIRVLHELKKEFKNIKYMIVGGLRGETENAHQDALIELAKSLGVLQDVIFTGWQTDTPYFYSLFDIYLMTSMPLEGLGISTMEAYAAGVPVVGFDWFGAREILGENPNVVPSKDVAALAQAVKQEIARLPETRLRRGEHLPRARKLQERHSLPRRLKEHAEIYRDLLENRERC